MFRNYFRLAFKVMARQKFFTAISLFGISFTIMIFSCVASMLDALMGYGLPSINTARTLYVQDSYQVMEYNIKPLKSPEKVSLLFASNFPIFSNNQYLEIEGQYTDAVFWSIEKFMFIEGKPYEDKDVRYGNRVAVITKSLKEQCFGSGSAIGKDLVTTGFKYRVIGVVENINKNSDAGNAEIWVPLNSGKSGTSETKNSESYQALIIARSSNDFPRIQRELDSISNTVNVGSISGTERGPVKMITHKQKATSMIDAGELSIIIFLIIIFMLIPALNLTSLNLNRISERSSEIGIRKSFGASSSTLIVQFLFENMIVTIIGGMIGFGMAYFAMDLIVLVINYATDDHLSTGMFSINLHVIIYTFFACLFFSLLSGIYPAWQMSRLEPVYALKGGKDND